MNLWICLGECESENKYRISLDNPESRSCRAIYAVRRALYFQQFSPSIRVSLQLHICLDEHFVIKRMESNLQSAF